MNFDIVIIGSGPGGYVAAIRASQLGYKVAIVEKEHLGGICLNWGCIPTKALLKSSELLHAIQHASEFGIEVSGVKINFPKVIERSRTVAGKLSNGIRLLMKKNKVEVFEGFGKLNGKIGENHKVLVRKDKNQDSAKTAELEGKHIIIATGARARILPGFEPDKDFIWTYKEALQPSTLPKSLLVVGSGAIGTEFSSFYHNLGVKVTLVEVQNRILPIEDKEISQIAHKAFTTQGIEIKTSTQVKKITKHKDYIEAELEAQDGKKEIIKAEKAIMAVGVVGNTENIGLENTGVKIEKSQIIINEFCQTDEKGIYAIGDVAGSPWLAHKASHEGIICVEKIALLDGKYKGHVLPMKKENIPGCTYSYPQIASVGLTEEKAKELGKEKGFEVKVGKFPYLANGKALAIGEPEGLIKTIFNATTGELLGAHMIGAEVTEMIQGFVIGKTMEAVEEDFIHTIFAHPTLSEMMHESTLSAFNRVIHI